MGSGTEKHEERATVIGQWLATAGVHLLTGGGGGVMEAVSRAFYEVPDRQGLVIGIIPGPDLGPDFAPKAGYPNPWVEIPIYTHLPLSGTRGTEPLSRNHINILTSAVIIALPGSYGTASEVALALKYKRPLVAYLSRRDQIEGLPPAARVEDDLQKVKAFVLSHVYRWTR
jgi:uncharacterized protein (TIGR00725 family)